MLTGEFSKAGDRLTRAWLLGVQLQASLVDAVVLVAAPDKLRFRQLELKTNNCFLQGKNARFNCGDRQTRDIMPSPITADDFDLTSFSGDICERIRKLLELNGTLKTFFTWFLDENGNPSSAFKALIQDVATPIGAILFMPVNSVPDGYLLANGQAVNRTVYANLFSRYGTKFGAGDGSTTFNLPNLQEKFLMGSTGSTGTYPTESTGGAAGVALAQAHLPASLSFVTDLNNAGGTQVPVGTFRISSDDHSEDGAVLNSQALQPLLNPGGGQTHNNLPPYLAGLWLVKT